jgi:hypothetical protein
MNDAAAEPVEKVPGEGDDVGCVVQAAYGGLEVFESGGAAGEHGIEVRLPGVVLVEGKRDEEATGVKKPTEDDLDFGGGSFRDELGLGEDPTAWEGFFGTGMRATGQVHCQWDTVRGASSVCWCVKENVNEIVDESVGLGGDGGGDGDSGGESGGKGDAGVEFNRLRGDGLGGTVHSGRVPIIK